MTDELTVITPGFLAPAVTVQAALQAYQAKKELIDGIMHEGVDFGTIPGSAKPALYKAGAEKATSFFGLSTRFTDAETVEDWTGKDHNDEPFLFYRQTCALFRGERLIASADGSCNSWEKKYRYRWVTSVPAGVDTSLLKTRDGKASEFAFAVEKGETSGKYGKPAEYWQKFRDAIADGTAVKIQRPVKSGAKMDAWEMGAIEYCLQNDEIPDLANTILKMAQKRALVAATLIATGMSDYFTQDIEDFTQPGTAIEGQTRDASTTKPPMTYETAAAMIAMQGKVEKRLDTLTAAQLQYIGEHSDNVKLVEAAEIVLEHDFNMPRPGSD
jgi:hypothetical protein